MAKSIKQVFKMEDLVPDLRAQFEQQPHDPELILRITVPSEALGDDMTVVPKSIDRTSMVISDGQKGWTWQTESLRTLFRGNRQPPTLGDYPNAYEEAFMLLDLHALEASNLTGDRRDEEMKEIYSILRRRPDAKSLGFVHDYMWQAAALLLGTQPLSQAEFEAIMARLERSCRTFAQGPTSRNYVSTLRMTFMDEEPW